MCIIIRLRRAPVCPKATLATRQIFGLALSVLARICAAFWSKKSSVAEINEKIFVCLSSSDSSTTPRMSVSSSDPPTDARLLAWTPVMERAVPLILEFEGRRRYKEKDYGALHRRRWRRESGKYFHSERDLTCLFLRLTIVLLREVAAR